jgi:hypothetical protein
MQRSASAASVSSSGALRCRLCWGEETDEAAGGSPLISPCSCRGSVGYIHVHCLQHWLEVSSSNMVLTAAVTLWWFLIQGGWLSISMQPCPSSVDCNLSPTGSGMSSLCQVQGTKALCCCNLLTSMFVGEASAGCFAQPHSAL